MHFRAKLKPLIRRKLHLYGMKIKYKLALIIFLVSVILITLLYFIYSINVRKAFTAQIERQLAAIAEAKYIDINQFITRRIYLVQFIAAAEPVRRAFEKDKVGESFKSTAELFKERFPTVNEITLLDKDGKVLFSSASRELKTDIAEIQQEAFEAARNNQIYFDMFSYDVHNILSFFIASPVFGQDSSMLGVLLLHMNGEDLMEIMDDSSGLGKTGETILGVKQDSGVVYLVPLRHDRSTTMKYSNQIKGTPIQEALKGNSGIISDAHNYRGKKVIAATKYIQETGWGLVTQIDKDEALKPVKELLNIFIILNLLLVIFLTIPAYMLGNYIARPIEMLIRMAVKINEGEFSERVQIQSDVSIPRTTSCNYEGVVYGSD